jgi:predicted ribosomally synthesized peptide with SipW-like signal peptide
MKKSIKKKTAVLTAAAAMACILAAGGILAYFTDADSASNTFTIGRISLELQEPGWDPQEGERIVPGQEISKDPRILNDGLNDEFVFLEVSVPFGNLVTADPEGNRLPAEEQEYFSYVLKPGWTELGEPVKNEEDGTVTHLYVYGTRDACTALAPEETTPSLFDSVRFVNFVEDQGLEETLQHIELTAYGIQAEYIGAASGPKEIWSMIGKQTPSPDKEQTDDKEANTDQQA